MGIVGGIVGVNGAKTRAHVISLAVHLSVIKKSKEHKETRDSSLRWSSAGRSAL